MKGNWRIFLCGCLTTVTLFGLIGTAVATVGSRTVSVDYNDIKVTLNGSQVNLVDANGAAVEPFAINGTTYLPVRAVANALDLNVGWDQATTTVILTTGGNEPSNNNTNNTSVLNPTLGQQNAIKQAQNYLNYMAFSYSGLIEQLEFEGYSTEEATYAVDNCGADWFEQAAKKAQSYLDFMAFSRDGLIDQLLFEGFTQEQAEYGASAVGY